MTAFLKKHGIEAMDNSPLRFSAEAAQVIAEKIKPIGPTRILLGVGASDPQRVWPLDHFAVLMDRLTEQGLDVLICGGPAERPLSAQLMAKARHPERVWDCTHHTLQETMALFSQGTFYIGNDTSLMNLAVNQGKQSFTFFGPTYTVYDDLTVPIVSPTGRMADVTVDQVMACLGEKGALRPLVP
jgi:ADP-heptose:LPS heptosyltransferase